MKKTSLLVGVLLAAVVFVPGTVSAHSYDSQDSHDSYSYQGSPDSSWSYESDYASYAAASGENYSATIVDTLSEKGNFTTLIAATQAAGLAETLAAPGDLTVFAPTDDAFAMLPAGTVEALLADKDALTKVLTNHVVSGRVDGETAIWVGEAQALSGNTLNIGYGDDGVLYINDSPISVTDIHTSNGIIHVVDAVILP